MMTKNDFFVRLVVFLIPVFLQTGCTQFNSSAPPNAPHPDTKWYDFEIVNTYPHDPEAFTQGLLFRNGYLYESTGRRGQSSLRKVEPETGEILQLHTLAPELFGEGLAEHQGKLIQLTLSAGKGFVYDLETFSQTETFRYEGNGWGLTHDGKRLIMSDGSSELRFLDPLTFQETGRMTVKDHGDPLLYINEMEMVNGKLFANILYTNHIAIICLKAGTVEGRIDLDSLVKDVREKHESANVLNGVAYDKKNGRLFVTGKLWPALFEIRIFPRE
jgi:glutaminyl-peptide cyclotransferase